MRDTIINIDKLTRGQLEEFYLRVLKNFKKLEEENEKLRKIARAAKELLERSPNLDLEVTTDDLERLEKALQELEDGE